MLDRFEQKYPYVKVELARASSADTARKVVEEYRAGYEKVDAFELASHGLVVPRDENILMPFRSPEFEAFVPDAIEWAHLDTYAWRDAARPGRPKGGDALGLRAIFGLLKRRYLRL